MDGIAALHTAARWYCISDQSWLMPGSGAAVYNHPNDDALLLAAQVNEDKEWTREDFWHEEFIPLLLWEIERATPGDFRSVDDICAFLEEAGRMAVEAVWAYWNRPERFVNWMNEQADDAENLRLLALERERFESHIRTVDAGNLGDVAPLPYRRTLSDAEADAIWDELHVRWPSFILWFLGEAELEEYEHDWIEGVYGFWWFRFAENVPLFALRDALREAGVQRVWQVDADHAYEVDVETFVPDRPGALETHFTSAGLDWVMYCDHESRITVAGDPLIALLNRVWPDWERYVDEDYTTQEVCRRCGAGMRATHAFERYCPNCSS